jgi:hypothetical protein
MKAKTKIRIKTSGFELELTVAEARELRSELNAMFGDPIDRYPWAPPVPAFPQPGTFPSAPPYIGDVPCYQPVSCACSSESTTPARNK